MKRSILFFLPLMLHCASIYTKTEINASPEMVWGQLMAFEKYPEWNPFLRIEGNPEKDKVLQVKFHRGGDDWFSLSPKVLKNSDKHLIWRGRLFVPGIFTGEHEFRVEQISVNRVIFYHDEKFNGLLVPFFGFGDTEKKFAAMNQALKKRSENAAGKP